MPYVTIAIIVACTLVQLYSTFGAPSVEEILRDPELFAKHPFVRWGYETDSSFGPSLITSAFVHDGWFHLVGNMLFLWLAGSAVEDRFGHVQFAAFYAVGAVVSALAFEVFYSGPPIILVGASGAISAVMGAFLVHFWKTRITFWYLLMFRTGTFDSPAWFALPLWLADQILWAYITDSNGVSGVAYTAHIGGFVFGVIAAYAVRGFLPKHDDDEVVLAPAVARSAGAVGVPAPGDRPQQLRAAIEAREYGIVRTLASRTILDLARAGDDAAIVDIYKAMAVKLERAPLTDGAFVAAATAADKLGDQDTFMAIAQAVIAEHPGSNQVPKVMWRLAELRRDRGDVDAAVELLRTLAARFPRDRHGQQAQQALDSRGLG